MAEFDVSKNEDLGGWFNVAIYATNEISFCPDFLTNLNAHSIVYGESDEILDFLPVGENISISEPIRKGKNGATYSITASFDFSMQSEEIDSFLHKYLNKDVMLIGIQWSDRKKVYGSKRFPLAFSYELINGKNLEDGNRIRVTVSGDIPQKPVYIIEPTDDEIVVEPES